MSTIRDVAAQADVHPSTVSRVFSGNAQISEATRQRVMVAARALNFQPNAIARSLSVRRTKTIGVIVPHVFDGYFADSFFPQLMAGLLEVSYARGYRLLVGGCNGYQDEHVQALDILATRQADGIVVTSSRLDVDTVGELQRHNTSLVLIGHPPAQHADVAWVDADNRTATRHIIEYLAGLGHRRIAYVGGDPDSSVVKERLEGYHNGMAAANLAVTEEWIDYGYFAEDGGYQAVERTRRDESNAPTAYYAANDLMAIGILRGLRERGIDVPGQVSLVGTNDSPEAAHLTPPLTSLRVPYRAIAAAAANRLIDAIEAGRQPDGQELLESCLIERESVERKV
ncbi:MAG: LacI family DNA-binding transcriptional regulator [Chloroflexi bacterium]|nr:LacI family DNA-binding transcriptional regulator [Chloroflexota bacterium]